MADKGIAQWMRWGQFRYSIIGGLLASPPHGGELQTALWELSQRHYRHPIHPEQWVRFGFSTLERWFHRARNADDPVAALGRQVRSDAGASRVVTPEVLAEIEAQYQSFPQWSVKLHCDNLAALAEKKPDIGKLPSYQTLRREMQKRGFVRRRCPKGKSTKAEQLAAERLEAREVRSFEACYVHELWHTDFHKGSLQVVDEAGCWHYPTALAVLDDHSRLCCHLQWYLSETTEVLVHGLMQAFAKRGLPRALLSDNGAAMIAHETRNGLARLAVHHDTTLPYSPYQNGKQERFWGSLEGRFLAMLQHVKGLTLSFLNKASQAWVEFDYNQSRHSELGCSPLVRLLDDHDVSRAAPGSEAMRLAFTQHAVRTQRRTDGTISVLGVRFEIPSHFRHVTKLNICYADWDKSCVYLIDPRTHEALATLWPLNKEKNADGRRRTLEPIFNGSSPQPANPIPPLLEKLLAQYAATGLPPAYLPKEEVEEEARHDG